MQLVRPASLLCLRILSPRNGREEARRGGGGREMGGIRGTHSIPQYKGKNKNKKLPWRAEGMAARGGKGAGWKRRQNQIPHMLAGQVAAEQQALPRDQNCELNEGISYARLFCFHLAFQAPACFSISPTPALSSESKRMKRNKTAKKREHKEKRHM